MFYFYSLYCHSISTTSICIVCLWSHNLNNFEFFIPDILNDLHLKVMFTTSILFYLMSKICANTIISGFLPFDYFIRNLYTEVLSDRRELQDFSLLSAKVASSLHTHLLCQPCIHDCSTRQSYIYIYTIYAHTYSSKGW